MRLIFENRVEQALRHLQPADANKISVVLNRLETENFESIHSHFQIHKLVASSEQVFVLRVTPNLRIIFKYGEDQTLLVEDIVSHEVLEKFFNGRRG